jgi:hypothetical protein
MISVHTDALRILTDASGTTPSPKTLRGLAISTHTFAPALSTCSGVASCIGIYSPGVGNTLGGCTLHWHLFAQRWQHAQGCTSHWNLFSRHWQHARGLCLALAFIRLALATRSGAAPRIDIYSPGVGNTLGGCVSHWHSYIHSMLATRSGTAPSNPMLATRSWATLTC